MAIRSGFFNSINKDRLYSASNFAEYFATFISNGVFPNPSTNLQVMANNDMTVTVQAGKAWINGYILINGDDYILTLDPADGVLNRIDRVVARYDTDDREIRLEVKKGTFASSPVAPALQRDADAYELALADVYIAAGVVSVTQANITDLRFNTELCGIVKGTVEQIDTTDLFAQYQAAFNDWFQGLKDVLDDNTAGNLLNLINQLDNDLVSHKADYATLDKAGHVKAETDADGRLIFPELPIASTSQPGIVRPDGQTIVVDEEGVLSSPKLAKTYFYDGGNENVLITGGWVFDYNMAYNDRTQEKQGGNMYMYISNYNSYDSYRLTTRTAKKISVSNISKLKLVMSSDRTGSSSRGTIYFGLKDISDIDDDSFVARFTSGTDDNITNDEPIELDVSSLSGEYYIEVRIRAYKDYAVSARIYEIWGES